MVFISEKQLERKLREKYKYIKSFFKIRCDMLSEEWKKDFLDTKLKLYTNLDKSHFLRHRVGLDSFTILLVILKKLNKSLEDVDFFEAGAYSRFSENPDYNPDIPFFMASGQVKFNYFGFEPENTFDDKDFEKIFSEESPYNITENIKKEEFKERMEKNITSDFDVFRERVLKSKNPLIFSNLVLGCPNFNENYNFWNLPGLHIDSFYLGDWIKYNKEDEVLNKQQKLLKQKRRLEDKFNDYGIKEQINLCTEPISIKDIIWYKSIKDIIWYNVK